MVSDVPFVDREQARVWFLSEGDGPAILLIHGGFFEPMDGEKFWLRPGVVSDLVDHGFRVLAPDRRFGGGRTSAPFMLHSWDIEARDMLAVLHSAAVKQAHIIAGSNGCSAALRLWLAYPHLVRSLTLCWPAPLSENNNFEHAAAFIEQHGITAYLESVRENKPQLATLPYGFALLNDRKTVDSLLALSSHEAAEILRETGQAMTAGEIIRGVTVEDLIELDGSSTPVACVPATPDDIFHPRSTFDALTNHIQRAQITEPVPVSPSSVFPEYREAFNRILVDFLQHS